MLLCLPNSAWADGNLAEATGKLDKIHIQKHIIAHLEPRGALRVDDADLLANVEAVSGVDGPHVVASRASEAYRTEATVGGGSVARRGNL